MGSVAEGRKENKLGTMPIGPLILNVSVPIALSMLVQALYNVVDSIFVGRLSADALAAVSLAFPVQNLMIAVAVGTSVGVNSLLSRRLGEKDFKGANRAATNGLFLAFLSWILFVVLGLLFTQAYFSGYASNPNVGPGIAALGVEYTQIVTIASLGLFLVVMFERLLQATGRTMYSMIGQMAGAIINIILDPIMIFGLLGFPAMGVAGAAWATVIGQFASMFLGLIFNILKNKEINISLKGFRPHGMTLKHIYQVGLPSIIMQAIGSIMNYGLNQILAGFSSIAVAFFGAYFKLQSFVFMPVLGFNNGLVPIIAYNYGARKPDRISRALKLNTLMCVIIMAVGLVLFLLIPEQLLELFRAADDPPDMIEIGTVAMRIICIHFPVAAIVINFIGFFQATGFGVNSLIISVVRQLGFLLPAAYILSKIGGLDAIWWSFLVAEGAALVLAIFLFRHSWRKAIVPIIKETKEQPISE